MWATKTVFALSENVTLLQERVDMMPIIEFLKALASPNPFVPRPWQIGDQRCSYTLYSLAF